MDTIWANCKNSPRITEDCFCTIALRVKYGDGSALVFGSIRFRKPTEVQNAELIAGNQCSAAFRTTLKSFKRRFSFF